MIRVRLIFFIGLTAMGFLSCCPIPHNLSAVSPFDIDKYMGKWCEIARLDHSFERGLTNVTAEYSLMENGKIAVVNRGFSPAKNRWSMAKGKAKVAGSANEASLKVSFFGPFYAPYKVVALDEAYRYAMVVSCKTRYLWFLSRETTLPDSVKQQFIRKASDAGFDTDALIWVEHNAENMAK